MANNTSTKKPTISDVAKLAKVGKTSVSRYLNGEFDVLSDSIKERVANAIETLNYRPNQLARSLKKGGTKLIAYVLPDITNPYSIEVMQGIEKACHDNGYTLLVCNTAQDSEKEKYYLKLLVDYSVEGAIFHSVKVNSDALARCLFSVVFVDRKITNMDADFVGLDNVQSATLATNYLIESGFEAILFITQSMQGISSRIERVQTFQQVAKQYKHVFSEVREITIRPDEPQYETILQQTITQFCQKYPGIRKAIISINGSVTMQIALACKQLNLMPGRDIGFLGFDDPIWAEVVGNGITSIRQPTYQIGYSAFELLLKRINGNKDKPKEVCYNGELIIRDSTR